MNAETIEALKKRMAEPCTLCTKDVFKYLMDPQVQGLMAPWVIERNGMLQLHVHSDALTRHDAGILFLMAVHITPDMQILYYTPASLTVEGAFEVLKEVIERENKRCDQKTGGGAKTDDVGGRAKKKRRRSKTADGDEPRGSESGAGEAS